MWVFKLGGSLIDAAQLHVWLTMLSDHGAGRAVIVPGGSIFADTVRTTQQALSIDDAHAHRMALLAMAQFGYALCGIEPRLRVATSVAQVSAQLHAQALPVWLPFDLLQPHEDVDESWRMSADSIAAWLANRLCASHLVLVKAAAVDARGDLLALAAAGIVDALLPSYAARGSCKLSVVGAQALVRVRDEFIKESAAKAMIV